MSFRVGFGFSSDGCGRGHESHSLERQQALFSSCGFSKAVVSPIFDHWYRLMNGLLLLFAAVQSLCARLKAVVCSQHRND